MKFPNDIRYANRVWMAIVLVSPILQALAYIFIYKEFEREKLVEHYVSAVVSGGLLLIAYWCLLLPTVLVVNGWKLPIATKKWLIFAASTGLILVYFMFPLTQSDYTFDKTLAAITYFGISSLAIRFFELLERKENEKEELDVFEHLVE